MGSWNEAAITLSTEDLDKATSIITMVSSSGIYIEDYSDMLSVLPTIGHYDYISYELLKKDNSYAIIHMYLSDENDLKEALSFINERFLNENIRYSVILRTVDDSNWADGWKQYFHARKIGKRVVICPSWEEYIPRKDEVVILLDPGMSFGTGDHESTRLSLELLEESIPCGKKVLDIGTGSGILSITAVKLLAKSVIAVDIDAVSVSVARANAIRNKVEECIDIYLGDIRNEEVSFSVGEGFDLITANIVADFHIACKELYYRKLRSDGLLIVSGIIINQLEETKQSLTNNGFSIIRERISNDWCALLLKKNF